MKKLIKKTAATALSAAGILSAVPSAFCAPDGAQNNGRGHIDSYNAMIVSKYLGSIKDIVNLQMANKKYRIILERFLYNPVEINVPEQLVFFPRMETYRSEKFKPGKDFVYKFPKGVKKMIYLPGSFGITEYWKVLKENGILNKNRGINEDWNRKVEVSPENFSDDLRVVYTSNNEEEITFLFNANIAGNLGSTKKYFEFLESCGLKKEIREFIKNFCGIAEEDLNNLHVHLYIIEVNIPEYVTSIGEKAFDCCGNLRKVVIPNTVKSIGKNAFSYCSNLTQVNIPNSVKRIEDETFMDCLSLAEVTIPNSVESIGKDAFGNCEALKSIHIPDSVTNIEELAFAGCSKLKDVILPNSITELKDETFMQCENLEQIVIPDSVVRIGGNAFVDCVNLQKIYIPNSLLSIERNAFSFCHSLNHIEYNGKVYTSVDSFFEAFYAQN